MSQTLPVNNFMWAGETNRCNEDFIKGYNDDNDGRYFFEVDAQYPKKSS